MYKYSIPSIQSDIQIGSLQPLCPSIWDYALGGLNTLTVKSSDHGVEKFSLNEVELFPAIVCAYCCFTQVFVSHILSQYQNFD